MINSMKSWVQHLEEINRLLDEFETRSRDVLTAIAEIRQNAKDKLWLMYSSYAEFKYPDFYGGVSFILKGSDMEVEFDVYLQFILYDDELDAYLDELRAEKEAREMELYEKVKAKYPNSLKLLADS